MSITQCLRVSLCFVVGEFSREVDVAIPRHASILELLPRCTQLCQAPRISKPWQASTVVGQPLDMGSPVGEIGLADGDTILVHPRAELRSPVVRDSAESLAATAHGNRAGQQLSAVVLAAQAGAALLTAGLAWWWLAFAVAAFIGVVIVPWQQRMRHKAVGGDSAAVALASIISAGLAGGFLVAWGLQPAGAPADLLAELSAADTAWALLSGVAVAALVLVLMIVYRALSMRVVAALTTAAVLLVLASAALSLPSASITSAFAGALIACGVLGLALAPMLATKLSGIPIPRLLTAGQELSTTDHAGARTRSAEEKSLAIAQRTHDVHAGIVSGIAATVVPALLAVGTEGEIFAQMLCLAVAGAVCLHAARHHHGAAVWALLLVVAAAVIATGSSIWAGLDQPGAIGVALVVMVAASASPVWAPKVRNLEPTTMVWLERLESLAVAACLPLALQVIGVFAMIRGLG